MDELATLIRLARLVLDEKRKILAAQEEIRARLVAEKERLLTEMAEEARNTTRVFEGELSRGSYVKAALQKVETLEGAIAAAEAQVEQARAALQETFEEVKRYEIAQDLRAAEAAKKAARRETKALDEVGGETKRRQDQES